MDSMLSQEEINALLNGIENGTNDVNNITTLSEEEKDAIGEISNINMGTAATTLSTLVNHKVTITTPLLTYSSWDEITSTYSNPCVFVQIAYKDGLSGKNVLILDEKDVKIIADLMMGGDGNGNNDEPISEFHLSAISEAMNQMMGSSATSLSQMIERKVDISPPVSKIVDPAAGLEPEELEPFLSETFVKVSFKMEIEGVLNSQLMQLYPMDFAKDLYKKFTQEKGMQPTPEIKTPDPTPAPEPVIQQQPQVQPQMNQVPPMMQQPYMQQSPPMQYQMPQGQMPQGQMQYQMPPMQNVNVAPVQFSQFAPLTYNPELQNENIDLIMDVPLEVTVELGRTNKSIKEILDFKPGTIVELNKIAGEPVDILVNGKFVAKGEVVVIDECFGIRVTEIIK